MWATKQDAERRFWGNAYNAAAFNEVVKQECYMRRMLLARDCGDGNGDLHLRKRSILDVGGGPWSMLLRAIGGRNLTVVDPFQLPPSAARRYQLYGIRYIQARAETRPSVGHFSEAWVYNVLEHTESPAAVLAFAAAAAAVVRVFAWLHQGVDALHMGGVSERLILDALGKPIEGGVVMLAENECFGLALAGVFRPATASSPNPRRREAHG